MIFSFSFDRSCDGVFWNIVMDLSDIVSIARPNLWEGHGHLPGFTVNIFCIADENGGWWKEFQFPARHDFSCESWIVGRPGHRYYTYLKKVYWIGRNIWFVIQIFIPGGAPVARWTWRSTNERNGWTDASTSENLIGFRVTHGLCRTYITKARRRFTRPAKKGLTRLFFCVAWIARVWLGFNPFHPTHALLSRDVK